MPGGSRTTSPDVERTTGGSAADDHRYSTLPSGRAVAPDTVPFGVCTCSRPRVARSYRHSWLRASKLFTTSSAEPSGYHSALRSPSRRAASARSVSSPDAASHTIGSQRPRR